MYFEQFHLVW